MQREEERGEADGGWDGALLPNELYVHDLEKWPLGYGEAVTPFLRACYNTAAGTLCGL